MDPEHTDTLQPKRSLQHVGRSEVELKRQRDREKQARCRAKKRATDAAHSQKVSSLEQHILVARHRLGEKFAQTQTLRKQVADLTHELATLKSEAQRLAVEQVRLQPQATTPTHVSEQDANCALPEAHAAILSVREHKPQHRPSGSLKVRPLDDAVDVPPPPPGSTRPCALFSSGPPPCKFDHHLSVSRVGSGKPYWEGLTVYRSRLCREMRCRVDDIRWLLEVELHPELTQHGPITSTLQTPECSAKFTSLWLVHLLEMAMLLTIIKRLQKLRADAETAQVLPFVILAHNSPPTGNAAHSASLANHLPLQAAASSSVEEGCGSCTSAAHAGRATATAATVGSGFLPQALSHSDSVASSVNGAERDSSATPPWAFDHTPEPEGVAAHSSSAGIESLIHNMQTMLVTDVYKQQKRPRDCLGTWEALKQSIRGVIARIFGEYVPWMRPQDVLQLCRRLHSSFGDSVPPKEGSGEPLTAAAAFAGVIAALNDVTQGVAMDVRTKPRAPHAPSTIEELDKAIDAAHARMHAINFEWNLLYNTVCIDSTSKIRSLTQWVNPVTLGYAEYEKLNLVAWNMLDLSKEQKVSMAAVWRRLQSEYKRNLAEFRGLARKLLFFPSAADLGVSDASALLRFADELHKHHQSLATEASELGEKSHKCDVLQQPTELDPYAEAKQHLKEPWRKSEVTPQAVEDESAAAEQVAWLRGLLGVSPDATDAAGHLLCHLRDVLGRQNSIFLDFNCGFLHVFSMEQEALYVTGMMPFYADAFKIAGMARADICCQYVYGRPALCW